MTVLRIGVDFDNTIASYEGVFYQAALEKKLIPQELDPTKGAVRDYLRSQARQDAWTELQGYVYGAKMDLARPYPGVDRFFSRCFERNIPAFIISHKTKTPFLGPPYNLHEAAIKWLQKQAFVGNVSTFFELTLHKKLHRIEKQRCAVFIDDLPELLCEPHFPAHVKKILFDPHELHVDSNEYVRATSWEEICHLLDLPFHGT